MEGNENKVQKLFEFCVSGNRVGLADYIISSGCNPSAYDSRDSLGKTALHIACRHGHLDSVRALVVAFGCSADVTDYKGNLPLHDAFAYGHLHVVDYVIKLTCVHESIDNRVLYTDNEGNTMLHKACQSGNVAVVRYATNLISRKKNFKKLNLYLDSVALYGTDHETTPFQLEEAFLTINKCGDTPLHVACRHGHLSIILVYIGVVMTCDLLPSLVTIAWQCCYSHIASYLTSLEDSEEGKDSQVDFYSEGVYTLKNTVLCCTHQKPVGVCSDVECCHFSKSELPVFTIQTFMKKNPLLCFAICPNCQAEICLDRLSHCARYFDFQYIIPETLQCVRCQHSFELSNFFVIFCSCCNIAVQPRPSNFMQCRFCKPESHAGYFSIRFYGKKKLTQRKFSFSATNKYSSLQSTVLCRFIQSFLCSKSQFNLFDTLVSKKESLRLKNYNRVSVSKTKAALLEQYNVDVNTHTGIALDSSTLHISCEWGSAECVLYFLSHDNCDIDAQNEHQETPMHIACKLNKLEVCQMLVEKNCRVDIKTKDTQETPIHLACCHKNLALLEILAKHPSMESIIDAVDVHGDTALFNACRCGEPDIVKLLMEKGANPLFINKLTQETPVHIACRMGRLDILQVLLKGYSGQLSQKSLLGATPLHLAVEKQFASVITFLVESNYCEPDVVLNQTQSTLLHIACYRVQGVVETLLKNLSHYDMQDTKGNTALHIACSLCNSELVKLLAPHCSISIQNNDKKAPIHISCELEDLESIQHMLSNVSGSLDNCKDSHGNTALHLACIKHSLDIVEMLLKHCSVDCVNSNQETPIHVACRTGEKAIVDCLLCNLSDESLDSFINTDEDTFLHVAVKSNSTEVVKSLLVRCAVRCLNKKGFNPIHISCFKKDLIVTKLLAEKCLISVPSKNEGFTYLHLACLGGSLPIVKFLIEESSMDCQTLLQNDTNGSTPLHAACAGGHPDIMKYLISGGHCSIYDFDKQGQTPLFYAIASGHAGLVKEVLSKKLFKLEKDCKKGYPLLHCLLQILKAETLDLLVLALNDQTCTIETLSLCDVDGNNVIHFAIKCVLDMVQAKNITYVNTMEYDLWFTEAWRMLLFVVNEDILNKQNSQGNSPLHLLCQLYDQCSCNYYASSWQSFITLSTEQLLSKGNFLSSHNCQNKEGKTPLQIVASSYEMVKILVASGANPKDAIETFSSIIDKYKKQNPLDPAAKTLVLGHSEAGKSTLIKAISTDDETVTEIADSTVVRHTRGVSISLYKNPEIGTVKFHEFAGQPEYESANSTFLENALCSASLEQPLVFVVLVDVRKPSLEKDLRYWLTHIENHSPPCLETPPHLIALGSHIDSVSSSKHSKIQKGMQSALKCITSEKFKVFGPVLLDCRKPWSEEISSLKDVFKESYSSLRNCVEIDCRCHALMAVLVERFHESYAVKFFDLQSAIRYQTSESILPLQPDALLDLVNKLHTGGHVVLLKGPPNQDMKNYWIIINQSALFNEINGTLFAPEGQDDSPPIKPNTGVVSSEMLNSLFTSYTYDIEFLTEFLVFSELCQVISDEETLKLITNNSSDAPQVHPSERYYFFPTHVKSDRPDDIWDPQDYAYLFGWYLQCKQNSFLDARFLQVLLLRLTFSFAAASDTQEKSISLERHCDIWKNGIHWSTRTGVDVIVEVVDQTFVVMLLRCSTGSELKAVKYRSAVIKKILETKQQFCPKALTDEIIIHPSTLKDSNYPDVTVVKTKIHMSEIIKAVSESEPCVIDSTNKSLRLQTLLHFDPYMLLGKDNIEVLQSSTEADEEVSRDFLYTLSRLLLSFFNEIVEVLEVPSTEVEILRETWGKTPTSFFHHIFGVWKVYKGKDASYKGLRQTFDEYSIFCGRNPLTADSDSKLEPLTGTSSAERQIEEHSAMANPSLVSHPMVQPLPQSPSRLTPHQVYQEHVMRRFDNMDSQYGQDFEPPSMIMPQRAQHNQCATQ